MHITIIVKPLSVLSVRNENQSLDVVLSFYIFVFKFFYEIYKEFLLSSPLDCGINLAVKEKNFGMGKR